MTPVQSKLWQLLAQPHWRCVHPERLPLAPRPPLAVAQVRVVLGQGKNLPTWLQTDLLHALSLSETQFQVIDETEWLAQQQPNAPVLLGFDLTSEQQAVGWQGHLPLTAQQKRELWSYLCRCYFAP